MSLGSFFFFLLPDSVIGFPLRQVEKTLWGGRSFFFFFSRCDSLDGSAVEHGKRLASYPFSLSPLLFLLNK